MRAEMRSDLKAIAHNISMIKERTSSPVMAVVKADAYGHGLVEVSKTAIDAGATQLGVALLEEALTLRAHGITSPVLAWLTPPGSDFSSAIKQGIEIAIPSMAIFNEVSDAAKKLDTRARVHIEVDTGMTRGGFLDEWKTLLKADFSNLEVVGIFSHFARADEPGQSQNSLQRDAFLSAIADLKAIGITNLVRHLSNSAATLIDKDSLFDLVRVGIALYGLTPDIHNLGTSLSLGLKPAAQLRVQLHLVKKVPAHSPVGYGATESTTADTYLGVVAAGYADGIPRIAHNAGVFVNGQRAPIIGRVSMDQFVVDLGANSQVKSGDWVTVFGPGLHGEYTADDWADASQSINYEIVTRIGPRVPRIYEPHVY